MHAWLDNVIFAFLNVYNMSLIHILFFVILVYMHYNYIFQKFKRVHNSLYTKGEYPYIINNTTVTLTKGHGNTLLE